MSLLAAGVDVVRGNASELRTLAGDSINTGIGATDTVGSAVAAAKYIAQRFSCIVIVTGESDLITGGQHFIENHAGTNMLTKTAGTGCSLTAIVGAFIAVNSHYMKAAAHAIAYYTQCAMRAAQKTQGPGSFQVQLLNHLSQALPA